jgi:Family of unknown function (DUF6714)
MDCRKLIEEAFAEVPYPGDDNIADHLDCLECDEIRAYFRGKSWRDLKFPELRAFHESLPLFTPEAFHYFLPGYMLATLDDLEQAEMIPYSIITIGGYPDDASNAKEEAQENRKRFTESQRRAIAAWLREFSRSGPLEWRDDPEIEYALKQILEN